jgi:hypothetical protein
MGKLLDIARSALPGPGTSAPLPPLSPAQEARRQKVLALLDRDGGKYAIHVEDPSTDPVIAALATPHGSGEVRIPKDRYDAFEVLAMADGWNRPVLLDEALESACEALEGLTPEVFRSLLSREDIADIEAGDIPVETLRAYAMSFAEGIREGRITLLERSTP